MCSRDGGWMLMLGRVYQECRWGGKWLRESERGCGKNVNSELGELQEFLEGMRLCVIESSVNLATKQDSTSAISTSSVNPFKALSEHLHKPPSNPTPDTAQHPLHLLPIRLSHALRLNPIHRQARLPLFIHLPRGRDLVRPPNHPQNHPFGFCLEKSRGIGVAEGGGLVAVIDGGEVGWAGMEEVCWMKVKMAQ